MELTSVTVAGLIPASDSRPINPAKVTALVASIREVGLLQPIAVTEDGRLVFGQHRHAAFAEMGEPTIPAVVMTGDDLHLELARCHENLIREDLTALARGDETARAKRLYETLHPDAQHGGDRRSDQVRKSRTRSERFTQAEAKQTGQHEATVRRDAQIGEGLTEATKALLRGTDAEDHKTTLITLAQVDHPATQQAAAQLLVNGEAKSAKAAIAKATQQEAAALFTAAGADEDPGIVDARLLVLWSRGAQHFGEHILELEPATVARVLPRERQAETRVFIGTAREWLDALRDALDRPLQVLNGKE